MHLTQSGDGCRHHVHKCKWVEGVEGQKPETKPLRLGFRPGVSYTGWWWCVSLEVVAVSGIRVTNVSEGRGV